MESNNGGQAWTEIVRGGGGGGGGGSESDLISAVGSLSTSTVQIEENPKKELLGSDNNGNACKKKQAWSKPKPKPAVDVESPVIGGALVVVGGDSSAWPALSEATVKGAASHKSSLDSPKYGSQGSDTAYFSQKQGADANSNQDHKYPSRQKSMKRHGGNVATNGGPSQPSPSHGSAVDIHNSSSSRKNTNLENGQKSGSGPSFHNFNTDQQRNRSSSRRGNGYPHSRGDGAYNHAYGGDRRDHDRANRDWNSTQSFNGRDAHLQPRGYIRPLHLPPGPVPFMANIPPRPFINQFGFPEMFYVPYPMPMFPPPAPSAVFTVPDSQLHDKLLNQIEYYFSNENLVKDMFLRQNMDDQGWVPITLIAGFKKVMQLTDNIQLILDTIQISSVVELQNDKVRKRNDWKRWTMPPSVQFPPHSSTEPLGSSRDDVLAADVQNVTLVEKSNDHSARTIHAEAHAEAILCKSSSGDSNSQFKQSSSAMVDQIIKTGSDNSFAARNSS